ncbi:MAG: alpha/beta hydrolase [Sandaracinaceae bacterium]
MTKRIVWGLMLLMASCDGGGGGGDADAGRVLDGSTRSDGGTGCSGAGTSRGILGDPQLERLPAGATRVYYAGVDEATSQRCNALGDPQVLYYDLYPAPATPNGTTVLYLHGGGYNVGYANNGSISTMCEQLRSLGSHCVALEYRRGFVAGGDIAVTEVELTAEDAARFEITLEMALTDVLDAWAHLDARAGERGTPTDYIVMGESAGGSLASRMVLTRDEPKSVVGAVIGFGTHRATERVVESVDFPVAVQGGLFDTTSPAYDNAIWFDADMPVARGLVDLYTELRAHGTPAFLYLNLHAGHGLAQYQEADGTALHYPEVIRWFLDARDGVPVESGIEHHYRYDDCEQAPPRMAGDRVRGNDGLRYDPVMADLENGDHPEDVMARYGRPSCP